MLALAGGVDLEVGRTVPTERCMIIFCLPNPPLPTPIPPSLSFLFEVDAVVGVTLSFAALFKLITIPLPTTGLIHFLYCRWQQQQQAKRQMRRIENV